MQAISKADTEYGPAFESDLDGSLHHSEAAAEAHEIALVAQSVRKIVAAHVRAGASVALQSILRDLKKDLHDPYEKIDGKRRPQEQLIAQLCAAYEEAADEVSDNWLSNFIPDDKE